VREMKKALAITALILLSSCGFREKVSIPFKYYPGQKVLMKTGHVAVITDYTFRTTYRRGDHPPVPEYWVRIGYSQETQWVGGTGDTSKFRVREFEIEKVLQ